MNELVLWARHWPKAKIHPIELLEGQAYPENKDRRNRFYENFGFEFDYTDPEHEAGRSRPMLAEALTPVNSWKENIRRHDLLDFLVESLYGESVGASSH